ncbi:uncharacterized protein JCM15063_004251 [Sporobolomyces koalae]|uniref:uncharacterized protein n=1 Tax=Sporobolomyces koalae TaxID=500713 RepID=UPI00317AA957
MSASVATNKPSLSTLPEGLQKKIIQFLVEIDEEEDDAHDSCGSCCGDNEDENEHANHARQHVSGKSLGELSDIEQELDAISGEAPIGSNVSNLSLTSKLWHQLCCAAIWQSPDLAERSTESLLYFYRELLPKYAQHVWSLFLMQTLENIVEEEDSPFQVVQASTESDRELLVAEEIEKIAKVGASADLGMRKIRATSLILGEIVRSCPELKRIEFDCTVTDPDRGEDASDDIRDNVLLAVKEHASKYGTITHIGYSLSPDSTSTYEDLAGLLSPYKSTLKSLRLDCFSAKGDKQALFAALSSLSQLETLDLGESDFVDDEFAELDFSSALNKLVLGETVELSISGFVKFVERFSSTLTCLQLDGSPYAGSDEESNEEAAGSLPASINLPRLSMLEIATPRKTNILDCLTSASEHLRELRIGFCPDFDVDEIIAFVEKRQDTLEALEIDVGTLLHEELAQLASSCEELGIAVTVVSAGFDDFTDGDFEEDDGDEEWESDDEE